MKIHPLIDPYAIHFSSFAGDVYTLGTASITLTAGTLTASTLTDGTASITSGAGTGFTTLDVDYMNFNGSTISNDAHYSTFIIESTGDATNLKLRATGVGSVIDIDSAWTASGQTCSNLGTVSAATSITSTAFVGPLTGTIQTAAQPNITSVGTLTSLAVTGLITSSTLATTSTVGVGAGYSTPPSIVGIKVTDPVLTLANISPNRSIGAAVDLLELDTNNTGFGTAATYGFRVSYDGSSNLFKLRSCNQTTANTRFSIARDTGYTTIGNTTALGQLHVVQTNSVGAVPVLYLNQADVSEEFILYRGTSLNASNSRSLVDAADFTTPGSIVGWIKINVIDNQAANPITDGAYYMPFYTAPTA